MAGHRLVVVAPHLYQLVKTVIMVRLIQTVAAAWIIQTTQPPVLMASTMWTSTLKICAVPVGEETDRNALIRMMEQLIVKVNHAMTMITQDPTFG